MIYYVVLVDGVPMDVTTILAKAVQSQGELTTAHRDATIVPCTPIPSDEFDHEEPTEPMFAPDYRPEV